MSRRRLLATAGMGAAGMALAAACGGDGDGDETPATGKPRYGERYQSPVSVDWGSLDPVTSVGAFTAIAPRIYNGLLDRSRANPDFWYYDLAEGMPEQPDEETYIFSIRPGVKIGPNDLGIEQRDMDAFDARVWQDRVAQDANARLRSFSLPWLDSYEAPDAQTFTMRTKGPYAYFFFRIGAPGLGSIPPREFWERGISLSDRGVGGGSYTFRPGSYEETGGISLDRNPNYYRTDPDNNNAQLPYFDGFDIIRITDRLARRVAFQDGQIHQYEAENKAEKDELLRHNPDYFVTDEPAFTFIAFTMNPTRPPWDNEKIRKAANFALNRQEFADRIFGEGEAKPNGLVHWPHGLFALDPEELEELQPYDPVRSRELIKAATGEDTIKIKVMYPTGMDIFYHADHLPIWKEQMRAAGFVLDEEPLDFGTWLDRYRRVEYDSSFSLTQIHDVPEQALDWHHSLSVEGNGNWSVGIGKLYPEIDEAIVKSKQTIDLEEAAERVRDAQRLIYEKGPGFLPIVSWIAHTLYQPFVKNVTAGLGVTQYYLNNSWLDL